MFKEKIVISTEVIANNIDSNAGGIISEVKLVPTIWVQAVNSVIGDVRLPYGAIQLKQDFDWITIQIAMFSGRYTETTEDTVNGLKVIQLLTFENEKDDWQKAQFNLMTAETEWLALITDRNLNRRLVGTMETPLKRIVNTNLGNNAGEKNNHIATFQAECARCAFYVT